MTTETVSGRSIPRWRGEAVAHVMDFRPAPPGIPGFRPPAEVASCTCGWARVIDGGHSDEDKARLARHHAGFEDP